MKVTGAVATLPTTQRTLVHTQLSSALVLVTAGNAPPQEDTRVVLQAAVAPKPVVGVHLVGFAQPTK